jgi:hypothetical protein
MSTTTSYSKISHIEIDFTRDSSDPLYSFLKLRLYTTLSSQFHTIYIYPSNLTTALDHLHNLFLASSLMMNPPTEGSSSAESAKTEDQDEEEPA